MPSLLLQLVIFTDFLKILRKCETVLFHHRSNPMSQSKRSLPEK